MATKAFAGGRKSGTGAAFMGDGSGCQTDDRFRFPA